MPDRLDHPDRLAALRRLALLDSPAEPAFDRLTRLAATFLKAPIALVSLIDSDRQFFKSAFGLPEPWRSVRQIPLSYSFCRHAVASGRPLVIEDTREHPLTRDNHAAIALGLIAYLGIPLITTGGYTLGTLCVLDTRPRSWSAAEIEILTDLAASVMSEIKLATRAVERRSVPPETTEPGILGLNPLGIVTFISPVATGLLGYSADDIVGQRLHDLAHRDPRDPNALPEDTCRLCRASWAHRPVRLSDQVLWRRDGTSLRVDYRVYPVIQNGIRTGAIATFVDSTEQARGRETARERQHRSPEGDTEWNRLEPLISGSPITGYVAGSEHVATFASEGFKRVIRGRDPIGKPLREVLPEIASQGILTLLDRVYETGEAFTGIELPVVLDRHGDGTLEEGFFTFIFQPALGPDGEIDGIALCGVEVTDQVRARREAAAPNRQVADHMNALTAVSRRLAEAGFDQQAILEIAVRSIAEQIGDICAIRILSDDGRSLIPVALHHANSRSLAGLPAWLASPPLPVDEAQRQWLAWSNEARLVPVYTPEEYRGMIGPGAGFLEHLGAQSVLMLPLRAHNRVIGLISVLRSAWAAPFTADDRTVLQAMGDRIGLAILNTRLYQQLGEARQQRRALVGRLLLAQEAERQRIAYDLHEDLAQTAAGAYQYLQAYVSSRPIPSAPSEALDQSANLVRRTIHEARRIVTELRPTVLDDFGLSAAIRQRVAHLQAAGWQISYQEPAGIGRLPAMAETALFRCVQEALRDIRTHAETTRVDLLLETTDQSIRLEIQTSGGGVDPETGAGLQGRLAGTRAWVEFLGGHVLLASRLDGSRSIIAEIPLGDR